MRHDLAIRGGLVATATETFHADIGIRDGRIATLAESITDADDVLDATGRIVMPGGIEAHCHIAQESGMGVMTSDDYESGSISRRLRRQFLFRALCRPEDRPEPCQHDSDL